MKRLLLLALFILAAGLSSPAQAAFEEVYSLDNGLKVILAPQPGNPVLAARVIIKTGMGAEVATPQFGLAHFIEHMAFRSSAKRHDGEMRKMVEAAGGAMNGHTWFDATRYFVIIPVDSTELALDVLSDMVFYPAHRPDELTTEKEVVVEELKRMLDSPGAQLFARLSGLLFPDHPYSHWGVGTEDTIRKFDLPLIKDFMDRYYRPDNAVLVLAGGFDPEVAKALILRYFGPLTRPEAPLEQASGQPGPVRGPRIEVSASPTTALAQVGIGFRAMTGADSGAIPAYLLASILSRTEESRLDQAVKIKTGLATMVNASFEPLRDGGLFSIGLEAEPDKVAAAVSLVMDELEKLVPNPPTDDELVRSRALAAVSHLAQMESSNGLAENLGNFEAVMGDWRLRDSWLPQYNRIEAEDLLKIARRIFSPENMAVAVILPEAAKDSAPAIEAAIMARAKTLALALATPGEYSRPLAFTEMEALPGGARLFVQREASLPLVVVVRAGLMGGGLAEEPGREGLASLMAGAWAKSTKNRERAELARTLDRLGATMEASSSYNSFELQAQFPAENWPAGLDLFSEILTSPAFNDDDVAEARKDKLTAIKRRDERPFSRLDALSLPKIYGDQSRYGRELLGEKDAMTAFTVTEIRGLYERAVRPENLIIMVAGDIEAEAVRAALAESLSTWKPAGTARKIAPPPAPAALTKRLVETEEMNRAQSLLCWSFQAPGHGHPDQPALDLLSAYFSGMSGPLFQGLRSEKGLAYSIGSRYRAQLGSGWFYFHAATDPAKTGQALTGFEEVLAKARQKELSPEELEKVRALVLSMRKMAQETMGARTEMVLKDVLRHQDPAFEAKYQAALAAVTAADIRRVAGKYLNPDHSVVAVAGKKESLDLAK